jgi:hypothetical protein
MSKCANKIKENKWIMDWSFNMSKYKMIDAARPFAKAAKSFETNFVKLGQQIKKFPLIKTKAKATSSAAMKHSQDLIKLKVTFQEKLAPKLLMLKKFIMSNGTVIKGNFPGVSKTDPAWSCNQIMNILDSPINGYYWVKTMCADKPLRVYCEFRPPKA